MALEDLNRAVNLEKDNSVHYANRSAVFLALDELESASKDCTKSLELNPANVGATYNFACVFSKRDKIDDALEYLVKAIALNPDAIRQAQMDPDLQNLRQDPRGQALLET